MLTPVIPPISLGIWPVVIEWMASPLCLPSFSQCPNDSSDCATYTFSSGINAIQEWYKLHYMNIMAQVPLEKKINMSYSAEELLVTCFFDGISCDARSGRKIALLVPKDSHVRFGHWVSGIHLQLNYRSWEQKGGPLAGPAFGKTTFAGARF